MASKIFNFLSETSIHPGSGQYEGAIDLPVARETPTDYPYVPGSGLKGALRDAARVVWPDVPKTLNGNGGGSETGGTEQRPSDNIVGEVENLPVVLSSEVKTLFGEPDGAGDLMVSDLRLLLLPVRCLTTSYRWMTCPHLLERFRRDSERASGEEPAWQVPEPPHDEHYLGVGGGILHLEERTFELHDKVADELVVALEGRFPVSQTATRLRERLTVVNDHDFAWFARYGLHVQAHNSLEKITKQSKALWFEETLPPDALMYTIISTRKDAANLEKLEEIFAGNRGPYLQVGGNETVGQGWFRVGWEA